VAEDAAVVESRPVGFEALASRTAAALPGVLRRIPFTGSSW
jgi:hypothetical protein